MQELWSKTEEEVLSSLESSQQGLTAEQAEQRLKHYGPNILKKKRWKGLIIFARQFKSPFIWILLAAVIVSAFYGEAFQAILISLMILLSSCISFYDEYKSEKIVDKLNKKIAYTAIVLRDGKKTEISVHDVVPGDILYLSLGSIVPADLFIMQAKDLIINESTLTGESIPVHKTIIPDNSHFPRHIAFAGTIVEGGECHGIVISTGQKTQLGIISKSITHERPETRFQKDLSKFGSLLVKTVIFLTISIFLINAILKHDILSSLLFALAIAVGLTPELLPVIISVSLSKGAHAMAKKDVIVKRLIAVEDFGNMDVLCTDKTGTLTEGKLSVAECKDVEDRNNFDVLLYGVLASSVAVHGKKIIGNPIDVALWNHASDTLKEKLESYKEIDDVPFDYERKRGSVVVKNKETMLLITKGSPQSILSVCSRIDKNGSKRDLSIYRRKIEDKFNELSSQGYRVIAIAYKELTQNREYSVRDEDNLVLLGYISFLDPPKKGIKNSILRLESLHIKFKILTGDNEIITRKIASEVGIPIQEILLADDIDRMSDEQLKLAVEKTNAFCRLTPNQKLRIIKTLKSNGHEVGYIGDGINDVPALHEADVGISVNEAVDVAKDASDIILMKKSIHALADGVIEGRKIFNNTLKYILMGTSSNFGNMLSAAGASLFLPFLPMLPVQILLTNMIYDLSQLTIPTDNVDEESLKKPKRLNIPVIKKYMFTLGPVSSLYDFITYFVMIVVFSASQALFQTGWFIESIMTELLVIFIIRTRRVPFYKSKPGKWLIYSTILIGVIALLIPFSPLNHYLGFVSPPPLYFAILIVMVITYLFLVERVKTWFFRHYTL